MKEFIAALGNEYKAIARFWMSKWGVASAALMFAASLVIKYGLP